VAHVVVELPSMLAAAAGGERELPADGPTLRRALDDLFARHPALRVHLFDESGALRRHVLCFLNGRNTRWDETLDQPLAEGDRITVLQAVSGG